MEPDPAKLSAIVISVISGILAFQNSNIYMSVNVFMMVFGTVFLIFKAGIMDAMSAITNPFVTFFAIFPIAFAYFTIQGGIFWPVVMKALGTSFIAGAVSMTVFNYWNIGG